MADDPKAAATCPMSGRLFQHLRAGLLELVLEVDVAGGQEDVDAGRHLGPLEGLGGALDVERRAAGQRRHLDRDLAADLLHRLEVAGRGDREPGLHHVHPQLRQLVGQAQLLGHGHAAAGRLLAVAQGGVEDVDFGGGRDRHGQTLGRRTRYRKFIIILHSIWKTYTVAAGAG
jgi:hypothetical protein